MGFAKVVIIDEQNRYLMMWRTDHPLFGNDPDLPGGNIERGETPEDAVVREVEEEAGIKILPANLEVIHHLSAFSSIGLSATLYLVRLNHRPEVIMSWEHSSYDWLSREEFLQNAKSAKDRYMHMVCKVVSKLPID